VFKTKCLNLLITSFPLPIPILTSKRTNEQLHDLPGEIPVDEVFVATATLPRRTCPATAACLTSSPTRPIRGKTPKHRRSRNQPGHKKYHLRKLAEVQGFRQKKRDDHFYPFLITNKTSSIFETTVRVTKIGFRIKS